VFIDHQPFVAFPVRSITPEELINNVSALAKVGKALEIPTVLTTINAEGGPLADPLFTQLAQVFPETKPVDRSNTNAWADPAFVAEIERIGRKKLVMCGLWTEVCLAQTVISAIKAGYEVYFVSDCSGGLSPESHNDAKQRMIQAGAVPMTWAAVMADLCPDNQAPEFARLYGLTAEHGGGIAYCVQYVLAQLRRNQQA
jgi:nicotinamidase-related amidase